MLTSTASTAAHLQLIMLIGCLVMGISHIAQPRLWVDFFAERSSRGHAGLVEKVMLLEFWPSLLIVALHQVWSGPAIVLTIFGWLLLAKVAIAFVVPRLAMRSMQLAGAGRRAFLPGGIFLLGIGAASGAALIWP